MTTGAHPHHQPALLFGETWQNTGAHERALARPGRADDRQHGMTTKVLDTLADFLIATEKRSGVMFGEGQETSERTLSFMERLCPPM